MLDFSEMQLVNLQGVDRIHPQRNKFVTFVEKKATGASKLSDSTEYYAKWQS